jgi:hypothetical protein
MPEANLRTLRDASGVVDVWVAQPFGRDLHNAKADSMGF